MFSLNNMFHKVIEDNLFESSTHFDIPIYIIQGKYDYQVSYQLAKEYLDLIDAPQKAFLLLSSRHTHQILKSRITLLRSLKRSQERGMITLRH